MAKEKDRAQLSAREIRRKRRVRNQIIVSIVMVLLLVGAGTGVFFGVGQIVNLIEEKQMEQALAEEMAALQEEQEQAEREQPQEAEPEEEPVEEYTEEDLLEDMIDAGIAEMSLENRVAGIFLTRPETLTGVGKVIQAGEGTQEALANYAVAGLVYAASNVQSEEQFTRMLTDTLPKSKYPLFLIMDGEHPLTKDLSEYGINMEFANKGEETEPMLFRTVTLPSLLGDAQEEGLVTAQVSAAEEAIGEACLEAWKGGADLLYAPENFEAAYEGMLEGVRGDAQLEETLEETLEKIYRIKYRGRLSE